VKTNRCLERCRLCNDEKPRADEERDNPQIANLYVPAQGENIHKAGKDNQANSVLTKTLVSTILCRPGPRPIVE